MQYKEIGKVLENRALIPDLIYLMVIESPQIARDAKAGQFLEIRTGNAPLLRKPISLFSVEDSRVSILYQVKGEGTRNLMAMKAGDPLDAIGPLGRGFTLKKGGRHLLVGGGIGIAPLYQLGKSLKDLGGEVEFLLGFSCAAGSYGIDLFQEIGPVQIATIDGSLGKKGTVAVLLENEDLSSTDTIYSCGPEPMLRYVQGFGELVDTELSLEAYMGCGLGACLSCVCKTQEGDYARVCKDGPVFNAKEVDLG